MKTRVNCSSQMRLAMRTVRRGARHHAVVTIAKSCRSCAGQGIDREAAIADALHRSRIFYAGGDVERGVLLAEARNEKVDLVLVNDTLHLPALHIQERMR